LSKDEDFHFRALSLHFCFLDSVLLESFAFVDDDGDEGMRPRRECRRSGGEAEEQCVDLGRESSENILRGSEVRSVLGVRNILILFK